MSSISSCDSYQISVEDEDEPYIKRLDELEEEHSGSDGSAENHAEKTQNIKNELALVSLYLKCKKGVYNTAYLHHKRYSDALLFISLLFSGSLVVFPFFFAEKVAISSLGVLTMICIFFKHYYNFDISSNRFNTVSLQYGKILANVETFLSKLVYFSNRIEKQSAFYEKMREIEFKLCDFNEETVPISTVTNRINVFSSIHSVEIKQIDLQNRYKMVKREIEQIKAKNGNQTRLQFLKENRKKIKDEIKNPDYSFIKDPLEKEYNSLYK
jgi:hypothetical protein